MNTQGIVGGQRKRAATAVKYVFLIVMLAAYLTPFFLIVVNSLKTKKSIIKQPLSLIDPLGPTFDNFIGAFDKMNFLRSFMNSALITVISVSLIIVITSMTAYFFVRANWKINKVIFSLMIAAMVVPFQAMMIPLVQVYGGVFHMMEYKSSLIFFHVGFSLAMAVFIYHGFVKSNVPIALEEAATIDGCTRTQTFFKVVFPLLKPTTATLVVLNVLAIWNDFLLPSLVLKQNKQNFTLPLSTYAFYGTYSVDYGMIMAALVLTTFPVIVLYLFLQKQIISGVAAGAVKG